MSRGLADSDLIKELVRSNLEGLEAAKVRVAFKKATIWRGVEKNNVILEVPGRAR